MSSTGVVTPAPMPGVDWSGCALDGAQLTGADFTGADLSGAKMELTNLTGARLTDANLTGTDLGGSTMTGADLTGATLTGGAIALFGVVSGGITGTPSSLPTQWELRNGFLVGDGASLVGADLSGLDLSGLFIPNVDLTNAELTGANLSNANLANSTVTGATLTDASLTGAALTNIISGGIAGQPASLPANWTLSDGFLLGPRGDYLEADMSGIDLSGADLQGANFFDADLSSAQMRNASLAQALLKNADLSGADGTGADLGDADLDGSDLSGANLPDANLSFASLVGASLSDANLANANLQGADLTNATITGANVDGVNWINTLCPDGMRAIRHVAANCVSALDTAPPMAHPAISEGKQGAHGWFISPVTVDWNWTDNGIIDANDCTPSTLTATDGAQTPGAFCLDEAGNEGTATRRVKIDTTRPTVSVTGVQAGHFYRVGQVPAAHCRTAEHISGVGAPARAKVTTTGSHGVGPFTATCSGAMSVAGLRQAQPVSVRYTSIYGMGRFFEPRSDGVRKSQGHFGVAFRLSDASGGPLLGRQAEQLASRHEVQARLTGPNISPVTAGCRWNKSAKRFTCTLRIPSGVRKRREYAVTIRENLGTGFARPPLVNHSGSIRFMEFR
ncbi:MAG TPA: pentapeptide repeat-containing protein [Streptosporangiaceae bacterium]